MGKNSNFYTSNKNIIKSDIATRTSLVVHQTGQSLESNLLPESDSSVSCSGVMCDSGDKEAFYKENNDIAAMQKAHGYDPLWADRKFTHSKEFYNTLPADMRMGTDGTNKLLPIWEMPDGAEPLINCEGLPHAAANYNWANRHATEGPVSSISINQDIVMMVDPKSGRCVPVKKECPKGSMIPCEDVKTKRFKRGVEKLPDRRKDIEKKDEDLLKQYQFHEQCFLLDNYEQLVKLNYKPSLQNYKNFVQVVDAEPEVFYNKLVSTKGMGDFISASPKDLSELVPYIKIWKIYYPNGDTKNPIEVELPMKNFLSEEDIRRITENQGDRGSGVGIESFDWDLSGTNLFEATRLIKANLVLYFQDINSLTRSTIVKSPQDGKDYEVSFLDLIYMEVVDKKTGDAKKPIIWNDKYYRMRIEVGWASGSNAKLYDITNKTRNSFFITQYAHNIDFKDDATVSLSLQCYAAIDGALATPATDILLNNEQNTLILKTFKKRTQEMKDLKSKDGATRFDEDIKQLHSMGHPAWGDNSPGRGSGCLKDPTDLESGIKNVDECGLRVISHKLRTDRAKKYSQFLSRIEEMGMMYYLDVDQEKALEWNLNGKPFTVSLTGGVTDLTLEDSVKKQEETKRWSDAEGGARGDWGKKDETAIRINYIFLGAILEAALSYLPGNELRNIVGTVDMIDSHTLKTTTINIAELPISLELFKVWFYEECVRQQLDTWSLSIFLNKLATKLFNSMYGSCRDLQKAIYGKPALALRTVELPMNSNNAGPATCVLTGEATVKKTNAYGYISGKNPFINNMEPNRSSRQSPAKYFYIGTENTGKSSLFSHLGSLSERKTRDELGGIYHLKIGQSRGLVKNIKFRKFDDPSLEASRIQNEGMGGLGGIAQIYNADVEMIGNNLFRPGSHVFIDTTGISHDRAYSGTPLSFKLGFGGYYMIVSVKSTIRSGEFITSLNCIWVASGFNRKPNS